MGQNPNNITSVKEIEIPGCPYLLNPSVVIRWLLLIWYSVQGNECLELSLQWRHNERDGVSNHQHHDCLLKRLFRRSSKKTSKFRVTGLCEGNSSMTGEFPAQRSSNAENVSIWLRHHSKTVWLPLTTSVTIMLFVFPPVRFSMQNASAIQKYSYSL